MTVLHRLAVSVPRVIRAVHLSSASGTFDTSMAMWSFGYGSNMDVTALQAKKHVKVLGKC